MNQPSVSVIIAYKDKLNNLYRCLHSWGQVTYSDFEIVLVDDGSQDPNTEAIRNCYWGTFPLRQFRLESKHDRTPAIAFNYGFNHSDGEFVVFTDEDLIFSCPDILQRMIDFYTGYRVTLKTYFLSEDHTNALDSIDWLHDPSLIEALPKFWEYYRYDTWTTNQYLHDHWQNGIVAFLTGQYRKDWEWLGMFREDKTELTRDQDIVKREIALHKEAVTPPEIACYHQWHPFPKVYSGPGYRYLNERQARLLEPAPPE